MQRNIRLYKRIIASLMVFSILFISACTIAANLESLAKLGNKLGRNITLTDARNKLPALFNLYSDEEVKDAIIIINDHTSNTMAELDYYEHNLKNLSDGDISELYDFLNRDFNWLQLIKDSWEIILIISIVIVLAGTAIFILLKKRSGGLPDEQPVTDKNKPKESFYD